MTAGCTLTDVFVCHCSVRLCWNGAFFVRGWLTIRRTFRAFCAEQGKTALLAQWDIERNLPLTPKDVTYGSHQKVWWRCPQGHSYRSKVRILARGTGCPVCAGRIVLPEEEHKALPRLALGAEIAWVPNLAEWPELPRLCLGTSRHFLLELPFRPWTDQLINRLYELPGRTGLTPVIAHIERYLKNQKSQHIEAVLSMGVPAQVSAEPLLHLTQRGAVLKLLRERRAQLIASDTHDPHSRPPNLGDALAVVRRRLGDGKADSLAARSGEILTHPSETNIRSI